MNHSSIERFGLNERDATLLLSALDGVGLHERVVPTTQWLSNTIFSYMTESHTDLEEMGSDLGLFERNPEIPFEYQDMLEKIQKLVDWQSASLYFYACGFFAGKGAAS